MPLGWDENQQLLKFEIFIKDVPGTLGKIASTLGELGFSIIHSEGNVLEKDQKAVYSAIV